MLHASEGHPEPSGGLLRRRSTRVVATAVAVTVGLSSALLFGGAGAASASTPRAQSVGRFLDGSAGGMALEDIVNIKDARATNPGTVTDQNPLDVSLGGQMAIPLSRKLQVPGGGVFTVGAANQVAKAQSNGYSYGASGAVANSGGASAGGNNNAYPADASIDLSQKALGDIPTIPITIPGAPSASAPALGSVTATIGAVSALASTPKGVGKDGSTHYAIGSVDLTLASPALGMLLKTLKSALDPAQVTTVLGPILGALPTSTLPAGSCPLTPQALPDSLSLEGGALTVSTSSGSLSIHVAALLKELGLNLNSLPANTDLLAYLTKYLSNSTGLATGIENQISGFTKPLETQFSGCLNAIEDIPGIGDAIKAATKGQDQLKSALNGLLGSVAGGSGNPLAPLADGLKQAVQIGVNVQPNGKSGSYDSPLRATPDQSTDPVNGQTIVRAIEVDLGGGQLALALANAAAGPSSAVAPQTTPTTSRPATPAVTHNSVIPTGVPAGEGTRGGTSSLPLVLLSLGLLIGGGGALAFGLRRVRFGRHGG